MKTNRTLQLFIILIILSVLTSIACGNPPEGNGGEEGNGDKVAGSENSNESGDKKSDNQDAKKFTEGVPVRTEIIKLGQISDSIPSTSVIEAEQSVDIYPRVTGTVTRILAEESQSVRKGSLLCSLEDEELRLQESKNKDEMDKLDADLERTKALLEKGIATETDLSNAEYNFNQAKNSWMQAKTNLEYTQIKSTINGIISEKLVRFGQKVGPADKLYALFDPNSLVVNVFIPESDYFTKVSGNKNTIVAEVSSESLPGKSFTGKIKRVSPVVDPQTNTIKLTITYSDPQRILRPGMYVRVRLITDVRNNAVLVPKRAVLYDENKQFVFIAKDGKAKRITLTPGYEDIEYVQALEGVEPGDEIIVVGQNGLKDNSNIRIVRNSPLSNDADNPQPETEEESN